MSESMDLMRELVRKEEEVEEAWKATLKLNKGPRQRLEMETYYK